MSNFTGTDVIVANDITSYQPDAFGFGIASGDSQTTFFLAQTTNDILRDLRIRWWQTYKTNVFTDITVLNTVELDATKVNLDQFKRAGVYLFLGRFLLPALAKLDPKLKKIDSKEWQNIICLNTMLSSKRFLKMVLSMIVQEMALYLLLREKTYTDITDFKDNGC
jgi:hypothetical protein